MHISTNFPSNLDKTKATGCNQMALETTSEINNSITCKKWQRVLSAMFTGKSFNRFESERQLNDHCLHTTVSALQGRGINILREFETVPGYQGIPTRVCRYWLEQSEPNLRRAAILLNRPDSDKEAA